MEKNEEGWERDRREVGRERGRRVRESERESATELCCMCFIV